MSQGSRPDRVADQIRHELATMLAREVHDPGIGFVTITRVQVTPDLQHARVFLRRQIGQRLRLKRVASLEFVYDQSIAGQDRIERLLDEIRAAQPPGAAPDAPVTNDDDDQP